MRNWIEILLSFRTFGFRPSANNDADARETAGGEFAFQMFVLSLANFRGRGFPLLALLPARVSARRPESTDLICAIVFVDARRIYEGAKG